MRRVFAILERASESDATVLLEGRPAPARSSPVAATNRNLAAEVNERRFRSDLYDRVASFRSASRRSASGATTSPASRRLLWRFGLE
jgi:hypothetical protein